MSPSDSLRVRFLAAAAIVLLPSAALAQAFETPPVLAAQDCAPPALLSGPQFTVDPQVPTNGLTTEFTIQSDAGTFKALGAETLALRVSEIPAIVQLDHDSKTETFVNAVASTAERPIESAVQMVASPVQSLEGLPGGIDRFFDRVSTGASEVSAAATDSNTDVSARGGQVADMTGGIAANALGYNLELRQLAKQLHVDPYTSNPVLSKKLNEFARVAFVAHVATNALITAAVPASMAISATTITRDLIYDTPGADLVVRNTTNLQAMGISEDAIRAFQQSPGFTLSWRTDFVDALQKLSGVTGQADVVALAATAKSSNQGLFLVRALRMLVRYQNEVAPLNTLSAKGTIFATDMNGKLIVPAPVDYVSWTQRTSDFANRNDLQAPQRAVYLTGRMSPMAKTGFQQLGWNVNERASDRP